MNRAQLASMISTACSSVQPLIRAIQTTAPQTRFVHCLISCVSLSTSSRSGSAIRINGAPLAFVAFRAREGDIYMFGSFFCSDSQSVYAARTEIVNEPVYPVDCRDKAQRKNGDQSSFVGQNAVRVSCAWCPEYRKQQLEAHSTTTGTVIEPTHQQHQRHASWHAHPTPARAPAARAPSLSDGSLEF